MTGFNLFNSLLRTSGVLLGWSRRLLALLFVFAALMTIFLLVVQPWYQRWGATDEEIAAPLPGDTIATDATSQDTRAITIDRPIDRVWPWLAQLGQDRGGFYSFDVLENLVGCEMPTEDILRPSRQSWTVGDKLWMYPPQKAGGIGFAVLREFDPGRALAFGTHVPGATPAIDSGSWIFVLRKIDPWTTRLIVRSRAESSPAWWGRAFNRTIFSPAHFVMERRMMTGIKELAEQGSRSRLTNHLQVVLWTLTIVVLGVAKLLVLTSEHWVRALKVFAAGAVLFAYLTLEQPPWFVGAVLVAALMAWTRSVARPPQASLASLEGLWPSHTGTTDTPARSA